MHAHKLNRVVDRLSRGYAEKNAVAPPAAITESFQKKEEKIEDIVGDDEAESKANESKKEESKKEESKAGDDIDEAERCRRGDGTLRPLQP